MSLEHQTSPRVDIEEGELEEEIIQQLEVELIEEEKQEASTNGEIKALPVPKVQSLQEVMTARYLQNQVPQARAEELGGLYGELKESWNKFSRDGAKQAEGHKRWEEIKKEWEMKKEDLNRDLVADGKEEAKFGTFPAGNPLLSLVNHALLYPPSSLDPRLSFEDRTNHSLKSLNQYNLWDTLSSGDASIFDTHPCQDHSSKPGDPTNPQRGEFHCDERIHALGHWLVEEIYHSRKSLGIPGVLLIYGRPNAQYFDNLRDGITGNVMTIERTLDLSHNEKVYSVKSATHFVKGEAGNIWQIEYELPHPSAPMYAVGVKEPVSAMSQAVRLDRGLEECQLLLGLPLSVKKNPFFSRQVFAALNRPIEDFKVEWGKALIRLFVKEKQERQVLRNEKGADVSEAWEGFTQEQIVKKESWIAKRTAWWSQYFIDHEEEFRTEILSFATTERPTSILGRATMAINWSTIINARKLTRPFYDPDSPSVIFGLPSILPLSITGTQQNAIARHEQWVYGRIRPRPLVEDSTDSVVLGSPSILPLAQPAVDVSYNLMIDARITPRPLVEDSTDSVVLGSPSILPLAQNSANLEHETRIKALAFRRPFSEESTPSVIIGSPSLVPLAQRSFDIFAQAQFEGWDIPRPFVEDTTTSVIIGSPSAVPLSRRSFDIETEARNKTMTIPRPLVEDSTTSVILAEPSLLPLSQPSIDIASERMHLALDFARPLVDLSTSSVIIGSPSVLPLTQRGLDVVNELRVLGLDDGRPLVELSTPSVVLGSPSIVPLALQNRFASTEAREASSKSNSRPVQPKKPKAGDGHVAIVWGTPAVLPLALSFRKPRTIPS